MSGPAPYHPTGETALIIVPPSDICGYADHYRKLYMPETVEQIEPHITLAYPFAPAPMLPAIEERLRGVVSRFAPTRLSLRGFEVFPESGVLYLKIAYAERVVALYRAVLGEFPEYTVYSGRYGNEYTPHMTVGIFEDREELMRVYEELSVQRLFIGWDVEQVVVKVRMSDGIWDTWAEIPLLGPDELR
jgi:2'-5' RNA ligase